jgi:hypothetical protein
MQDVSMKWVSKLLARSIRNSSKFLLRILENSIFFNHTDIAIGVAAIGCAPTILHRVPYSKRYTGIVGDVV